MNKVLNDKCWLTNKKKKSRAEHLKTIFINSTYWKNGGMSYISCSIRFKLTDIKNELRLQNLRKKEIFFESRFMLTFSHSFRFITNVLADRWHCFSTLFCSFRSQKMFSVGRDLRNYTKVWFMCWINFLFVRTRHGCGDVNVMQRKYSQRCSVGNY